MGQGKHFYSRGGGTQTFYFGGRGGFADVVKKKWGCEGNEYSCE